MGVGIPPLSPDPPIRDLGEQADLLKSLMDLGSSVATSDTIERVKSYEIKSDIVNKLLT